MVFCIGTPYHPLYTHPLEDLDIIFSFMKGNQFFTFMISAVTDFLGRSQLLLINRGVRSDGEEKVMGKPFDMYGCFQD